MATPWNKRSDAAGKKLALTGCRAQALASAAAGCCLTVGSNHELD
jgi:hypothetical protein